MSRPLSETAQRGIGGRKPLPDDLKRKRRVLYLTEIEWLVIEAQIAHTLAQLRGGGRPRQTPRQQERRADRDSPQDTSA